ncbi:MAG: transposase [Desulfobaccales bacterium]
MPRYLRAWVPGGTFFLTVVTFNRRKIFNHPQGRRILRKAVNQIIGEFPFSLDAWVLMADHLHTIWTLPKGDTNYGKRVGLIKANFSKAAKIWFHDKSMMNLSRQYRREITIWQRRFWEHSIRDEEDLAKHLDYLHYNPVKHGLVQRVRDWPYSSFHRLVKQGIYPIDWGEGVSFDIKEDFGE